MASADGLAVTLSILRSIRRWSQSELAEAAGVTNSAISDYERGKVDPQTATLRKLLRGLDLPVSALEETETFILRIRSQVGARDREPSGLQRARSARGGRGRRA